MGLLTLVEDRPTPKEVYNWRVYVFAATVASAAMMIGYDSAFIGTTLALPSFVREFEFAKLSKDELNLVSANIVSLFQAGAFFGTFIAYAIAHFIGRKRGLMIFTVIFLVGAGVMLAASGERGLGPIYAGRVLTGLGTGGASVLSPIYISEIAPPAIRGRLVGMYELGWQFGGIIGFWINYGINQNLPSNHAQWLIPFAVQLIPSGLLFIGAFFIKESPRWLYSKGKQEQGLRNLCWIRHLPADDLYIVEEVKAIEEAIDHQRSTVGLGFWQPFRSAARDRRILWRLILGSLLFMWQNGSGINAINYYSPTIFKSLGITGTQTGFLSTGIYGICKTSFTFLWLLVLIDRLGRRKLLLIGSVGGSCCMWYIGSYLKIASVGATPASGAQLTSGGISALFFLYLWTAFYTPSWNGTPWVVNSEFFQPNMRQLGLASAAASNWFWTFIISRFTPNMFSSIGYATYFFFASMMILSVPFVYFLLPETKAVPLEAMDRLFEVRPVRRANKVVLAELREEDVEFRQGDAVYVSTKQVTETLKHVESTEA